jgi:hypothetical protein
MRYTSDFDASDGICSVRVEGVYRRPRDSDELKQFAVEFAEANGCRRFLFDLRDADLVGGTMEAFSAATPEGDLARSLRDVRTAFVRPKLSEDDHFFETVAVNRGFRLKAFETMDRARAWLREEDAG